MSRWRTEDDRPLFVYGSLQFPSVHRAVLGRSPRIEHRELIGWEAVCLTDRPFPALLRSPTGVARGVVLRGLTHRERDVLDAFEGPFYDLVDVRLADGSVAATFVANDQAPLLRRKGLTVPWSVEAFRRDGLMDYEARLGAWLSSRSDDSAK